MHYVCCFNLTPCPGLCLLLLQFNSLSRIMFVVTSIDPLTIQIEATTNIIHVKKSNWSKRKRTLYGFFASIWFLDVDFVTPLKDSNWSSNKHRQFSTRDQIVFENRKTCLCRTQFDSLLRIVYVFRCVDFLLRTMRSACCFEHNHMFFRVASTSFLDKDYVFVCFNSIPWQGQCFWLLQLHYSLHDKDNVSGCFNFIIRCMMSTMFSWLLHFDSMIRTMFLVASTSLFVAWWALCFWLLHFDSMIRTMFLVASTSLFVAW